MPEGPLAWAFVAVALLFVVFLLVKGKLPLGAGTASGSPEVRSRLLAAKGRVREASNDDAARAHAWRDAATIALRNLNRPNLAASYALRAERAEPGDASAVALLAQSLRRAKRFRALEKLLWRRLASHEIDDAWQRAWVELIELYEGPMRRPEQARALRRMVEQQSAVRRLSETSGLRTEPKG